jgi:hypothetical protein
MDMQPNESLSVPDQSNFGSKLRALTGAERRLLEAVLIHDHRARLNPRVIPGPSQFVALFLRGNYG